MARITRSAGHRSNCYSATLASDAALNGDGRTEKKNHRSRRRAKDNDAGKQKPRKSRDATRNRGGRVAARVRELFHAPGRVQGFFPRSSPVEIPAREILFTNLI